MNNNFQKFHTPSQLLQPAKVSLAGEEIQASYSLQLPQELVGYHHAYAGHQFGYFSGVLGDGRAISFFEHGVEYSLKGSGKNQFSRGGDGKAVLRSSIREHLGALAIQGLGIPTTRARGLYLSGEEVWRDRFYNGFQEIEPGAMTLRSAKSFMRFGSIEYIANFLPSDSTLKTLHQTLSFLFPEFHGDIFHSFEKICQNTMHLALAWERVGFTHGVLNTDNMSLLGITLDYGPFGFIEEYDPNYTPNTSDDSGRYRFGAQAEICLWNLSMLANALEHISGENPQRFIDILESSKTQYIKNRQQMLCEKFGLKVSQESLSWIQNFLPKLQENMIDYTLFFRGVSENIYMAQEDFNAWIQSISKAQEIPDDLYESYSMYLSVRGENISKSMLSVNPRFILRNWILEKCIEKAETGDYSLIYELSELCRNPYQKQTGDESWLRMNPSGKNVRLSCSS